jgi:hypothetical protein
MERVRHLERHLGMGTSVIADKVAALIANIGDDGKTLALDIGARGDHTAGNEATDRSARADSDRLREDQWPCDGRQYQRHNTLTLLRAAGYRNLTIMVL